MTTATTYGLSISLDRPFEATVEATRAALAAEGFGVLMEADLRATFQKKLGVESPPYVILGACSPSHAREALNVDADLGLLLPCNVIVRRDEMSGRTRVAAIDPVVALSKQRYQMNEIAPAAVLGITKFCLRTGSHSCRQDK